MFYQPRFSLDGYLELISFTLATTFYNLMIRITLIILIKLERNIF